MTSAAAVFNKRVDNSWTTVDAKPYLDALGLIPEFAGIYLVETKRGRNGGTWAPPKLAVFFAAFCGMVTTKPAESATRRGASQA